jgi:hypothetical protein
MKLISFALLLSFAALQPAWGATPTAAEKPSAPPVAAAGVRAAVRAVWVAHEREGTTGVRLDSEACYHQFSRRPSWSQLDSCLTMDYVANTFIFGPYFDAREITPRWDAAARRMGVQRKVLEARIQRIMKIAPLRRLYDFHPESPQTKH